MSERFEMLARESASVTFGVPTRGLGVRAATHHEAVRVARRFRSLGALRRARRAAKQVHLVAGASRLARCGAARGTIWGARCQRAAFCVGKATTSRTAVSGLCSSVSTEGFEPRIPGSKRSVQRLPQKTGFQPRAPLTVDPFPSAHRHPRARRRAATEVARRRRSNSRAVESPTRRVHPRRARTRPRGGGARPSERSSGADKVAPTHRRRASFWPRKVRRPWRAAGRAPASTDRTCARSA